MRPNILGVCDFCGEQSELIEGACAGCDARHPVSVAHDLDAGEHSANDVYPVLFDRRRQTVCREFNAAPVIGLSPEWRPAEVVVGYTVDDVMPEAEQQDDAPLLFGRRYTDQQRTDAWQESLGVNTEIAA